MLVTDRNAVLAHASFHRGDAALQDVVDWPLMEQPMWNNTNELPDRMERRMAECLVHNVLPTGDILRVVVQNAATARAATDHLRAAGVALPVTVGGDWYF